MLLTHSITHNGQILEISVYYAPLTNTVTEIKSIWVHSHGSKLPVTGIMMKLFECEINKIVDNVDWREIYRAAMEGDCFSGETNRINMNNVNKTMVSYLAPHILNR
jgi:hypothetical protein